MLMRWWLLAVVALLLAVQLGAVPLSLGTEKHKHHHKKHKRSANQTVEAAHSDEPAKPDTPAVQNSSAVEPGAETDKPAAVSDVASAPGDQTVQAAHSDEPAKPDTPAVQSSSAVEPGAETDKPAAVSDVASAPEDTQAEAAHPEDSPAADSPRFKASAKTQTYPVANRPECASFVCVTCGSNACCPCTGAPAAPTDEQHLLAYAPAQGGVQQNTRPVIANPVVAPNPLVWAPCGQPSCEHVIIDDTRDVRIPHAHSSSYAQHTASSTQIETAKNREWVVENYNHARFVLRVNMMREADIRNRLNQLALFKTYNMKQLGMLDNYLANDAAIRASVMMSSSMSSSSSSSSSLSS